MKRRALDANVVKAVEKATGARADDYGTTSINLPRRTLALLQELALERKLDGVLTPYTKRLKRGGTKTSVSALIVELIERHRPELEAERDKRRRARR